MSGLPCWLRHFRHDLGNGRLSNGRRNDPRLSNGRRNDPRLSNGFGLSVRLGDLLCLGLGEPLLTRRLLGRGRVAGLGLLGVTDGLLFWCQRHGLGGLGLRARTRAALLGHVPAFIHGVRNHPTHQIRGADGVVIAGDDVLDDVRITVCVDNGHDGNAQAVRLGHRDVLLLRVDHEHRARKPVHVADTAEVPVELHDLTANLEAFLLDHLFDLTRGDQALHLPQLAHAGVHGLEVGEHPTEPAVVHVRHSTARSEVLNRLPRLLLGADEQHGATIGHGAADKTVGGVDAFQRLLKIDDVDPVALTEDEPTHLRVPAAGLMAEVNSGGQQLFHSDNSHGSVLPSG